MKCPDTDALVELAFIVSNDEPVTKKYIDINTHLDTCDRCRTRVDEYVKVIGLARTATAYSSAEDPCLDDETVAAYVDGRLDDASTVRVEQHIARCRKCLIQLSELTEIVHETADELPSPISFVLGLAQDGLRILSHPAAGFTEMQTRPVPVLGDDDQELTETPLVCVWRQRTDVFEMTFSAVYIDDEHVDLSIRVNRDSEPIPKSRLNLRRAGELIQSEPISETGTVTLTNLEAHSYTGEIVTADGVHVIFTLSLQPIS